MNVKWKSYVILLITFSLGISAGFLGAKAVILSTMKEAFRMGPDGHGGGPGRMGHGFRQRGEGGPRLENHILKAANPTDEQKEKLLPIVKKYQSSLDAVMEEHRNRSHALLDSMDKELATILDAGQMEKLRARRQHPPGMGPDGHGGGPGSWGGEHFPQGGDRPASPDRQGED